jgi:hypothetical protein
VGASTLRHFLHLVGKHSESTGDTCFEWLAHAAVLAAKAAERSLGAEHPDTLDALRGLARTLRLLGRAAEAEPLNRRRLEAPRASQRRRLLRQLAFTAERPSPFLLSPRSLLVGWASFLVAFRWVF